MSRHYKVHELLNAEELESLEAFSREPGRTVDEIETWLEAAGFNISRGAVWAWRDKFLATDRFRASNEVAKGLLEAAKAGDAVAISDAATLQMSQMILEQLCKLQSDGKVTTKELFGASMALRNVVASKRTVETVKEEMRGRQKLALAEADKIAKAGGNAEAVVNKVREILGIAA